MDRDGAEGFGGRLFDFLHDSCPHPEKSREEGGTGRVEAYATQSEP